MGVIDAVSDAVLNDFVAQLVRKHHEGVKSEIEATLMALVGEDADHKKARAKEIGLACGRLHEVLPQSSQPPWLQTLWSDASMYEMGSLKPGAFLKQLLEYRPVVQNHLWPFDRSSGTPIDFESIYQKYKAESRLPELFAEIVTLLHQLRDSGQIDSVSFLDGLRKVTATLEKGRDGTFFDLSAACNLAFAFMADVVWAQLGAIDGFGPVLASLDKLLHSLAEEVGTVREKVADHVKTEVGHIVSRSNAHDLFALPTYTSNGRLQQKTTPALSYQA